MVLRDDVHQPAHRGRTIGVDGIQPPDDTSDVADRCLTEGAADDALLDEADALLHELHRGVLVLDVPVGIVAEVTLRGEVGRDLDDRRVHAAADHGQEDRVVELRIHLADNEHDVQETLLRKSCRLQTGGDGL